MQGSTAFHLDTFIIPDEKSLENIVFPLVSGDRIFLTGDLGAGKSTFTRALLRHYFSDPHLIVRSPTYTYYQKYGANIYHFDLYRLESLEDLFLIGAREILDDPQSICLIEWPEILGDDEKWTKKISITRMEDESRKVEIISQK